MIDVSLKTVLEPIFEADTEDCAFGYRPKRSVIDAVKALHGALIDGYTQVVDADLSKFFDKIRHDDLMRSIALRIIDRAVLSVLKIGLQAPVQSDGPQGPTMSAGKASKEGTPQGGIISPMLANREMNRYPRYRKRSGAKQKFQARLVSYSDDFVILSRGKASGALAWTLLELTTIFHDLGET